MIFGAQLCKKMPN